MQIGLIIYGSLETISGGYLYDRKLVEHLRAKGHEVRLISLPWRNYLAHLQDNISLSWKRQLRHSCQGLDLLLQDELNHPSLFWVNQWLKREFSLPVISIVHHLRSSEQHPRSHRWLYPLVERAYLKTVDGFIFNSQTTQKCVEEMLGHSVDGIVAYPAGDHIGVPDEHQISARSKPSQLQPLSVLCVGNVSIRKGFHTVLSALATVPRGTAVVHVVGSHSDQPYVQRLERQINRDGLGEYAVLWGSLSDDELSQRYLEADILAVPSYEGFGIVYLEAMRYGLPVIGSTAGAAHEIISPGHNGYLIELNNSGQLARYLLELHADREKLTHMSQAAMQRYAAHPTWEESMGKIYERTIHGQIAK